MSAQLTTYSKLALTSRPADLGVRMHLMHTVRGNGPDSLLLEDTLATTSEVLTGVEVVIDAGAATALDQLFHELDIAERGPRVHMIGDAHAPRTVLEAVYEGRLTGATLSGALQFR